MFYDGFPFVGKEFVEHVVSIIPPQTYGNIPVRTTEDSIQYFSGKIPLSFPYRLYALEVDDAVFSRLSPTEKILLHCMYSRSCDGYVREKHIKHLLSEDFPDWAIPYIVKVCDEYVLEILQTVYENLKNRNTDALKMFCLDNWSSFCKSYNRMISYWNEFYRDKCYRFEEYVGRKLFMECFGAKRIMNCLK